MSVFNSQARGKEGGTMGDEGGDELDPYVEYIRYFTEEQAEKDYSGLGDRVQKEPTTPWSDGGSLRIILDPEYPENVSRHTKVQIYSENNPQQPLNIDIETLEYLLNVDLEKLLLYKYLTTEGSQQSAAGATDIFNSKISIPLNGVSGAERTFNLHYQTNYEGGISKAIYGPEGSGIDQIMNELGEIERGLNEHGITIDKRTGGIVIDGVVLSPVAAGSVLEAAELYQLFEDGHSNPYGRKQQELPQPCADGLREYALASNTKDYTVTEVEVLKYPGDLFGVEAVRNLP